VAAFSQAGGTVQWNLERWKTQVLGEDGKPVEAKIETIEAAGTTVHLFTATGKYQDGMPGAAKTPRENWTLRGAVLETVPNLTFVKMTGPATEMEKSRDAWEVMIKGMTK